MCQRRDLGLHSSSLLYPRVSRVEMCKCAGPIAPSPWKVFSAKTEKRGLRWRRNLEMSIVFEHAILGSGAPPSAHDSHVSSVDKLAPFRLKHVGGGSYLVMMKPVAENRRSLIQDQRVRKDGFTWMNFDRTSDFRNSVGVAMFGKPITLRRC